MITMVDFFRVGFLLAGILVNRSACETKCLTYLDGVREILSSKIPPINESRMPDNYYNISRALYPSVKLPALYVRVTIQFLKDYQNGTKMIDQENTLKYTWSKACSYVSVQHLGLYAMSIFSLFTIYPQRRQSELVITVPPFCRNSAYATDNDTGSETWKYVVATLEDIIINSKSSDPRLNTVSCVVKGHEGDIAEYPNLWYFYWFILASSFCASFSLWIFLLQSIHDNIREERVCGAALRMTCPITIFMFVVVACSVPTSIHLKSNTDWEMFKYYVVYIVLCLFSFIVGCICNNNCVNVGDKRIHLAGVCCLFPCLFQTVHHFLWVVCGIISEPFWAIPIFLLECLFFVSIFFASFLFEKEFCSNPTTIPPKSNERGIMGKDASVIIHLITCWVSFTLVLTTIALIAINNGDAVASPTAGAIESIMTVIFLWLVKNSRLDFWSRNREKNNPRTNDLELKEHSLRAAER